MGEGKEKKGKGREEKKGREAEGRVGKREGGKEEEGYSTPLPSCHDPYSLLLLSPLFDDVPGPECGD